MRSLNQLDYGNHRYRHSFEYMTHFYDRVFDLPSVDQKLIISLYNALFKHGVDNRN